MASVDGERSAKISSEESFTFECSSCENDGVIRQAKVYCPDCRDYLCEICEASHKRLRVTRNHVVVSSMEKQETTRDSQVLSCSILFCPCNRNVEVGIYCKNHCEVFCSECKIMKHRRCKTTSVDEMLNEMDENFDEETHQRITDIKDKIEKMMSERKEDLKSSSLEVNACAEKISSFSTDLMGQISELKEKALDDLYKCSDRYKECIEEHRNTYKVSLNMLSFDEIQHQHARKSGNKKQAFITNLKLIRTLSTLEDIIEGIKNETHTPCMSFSENHSLISTLNSQSLGSLHHNIPDYPNSSNNPLQVRFFREANVRTSSDQSVPWITGSVFLSNGELVLCDRNNKCLKFFDYKFRWKNTVS